MAIFVEDNITLCMVGIRKDCKMPEAIGISVAYTDRQTPNSQQWVLNQNCFMGLVRKDYQAFCLEPSRSLLNELKTPNKALYWKRSPAAGNIYAMSGTQEISLQGHHLMLKLQCYMYLKVYPLSSATIVYV